MKLEWLVDSIGQNYIGVKIPSNLTIPYMEQMRDILGEDYKKYTDNQKVRDGNQYHITVINVAETNKLIGELGVDDFLETIQVENIHIDFRGLGTANRGVSRAFFIVVDSPQLHKVRASLNLNEKDFHITLGFNPKDVFGVRKNVVIGRVSKLVKIIKEGLDRSGDFSFLEEALGLDDIKPISIHSDDNYIKISSGGMVMDVGLDDSNKLRTFTKYNYSDETELTLTEFLKIISDKYEIG